MNIAAYLSASDELVDFSEPGRLCLFARTAGRWSRSKEVPLSLGPAIGIPDAKAMVRAAVADLGPCQVVMVRQMRGLPRVLLEECGLRVHQAEGALDDAQFDRVVRREALAQRAPNADEDEPLPAPTPVGPAEDATYRIDLVALLEAGTRHVSRDLLLPFFETTPFSRLEIVCEHVPRWFAMDLPEFDLTVASTTCQGESETRSERIVVVVVPRTGSRTRPPGRRTRRSGCHCGG